MNYQSLFIGNDSYLTLSNHRKILPINFDGAATTPPLRCAFDDIANNLKWYASINRGSGQKSDYCTDRFELARKDILSFFHLKPNEDHTVIYVKSATEGLNLLANILIPNKNTPILLTRMEHHANLLPWRCASNQIHYVDVDSLGRIHPEAIELMFRKYQGQIKYVCVTGASNVTGYVNDINKIASICHKYHAKIIVDAAQLVAHRPINMAGSCKEESIDFLVFSAHKAYAPFGGGAVIGLTEVLNNSQPFLKGGSAVDQVFDYGVIYKDVPERFEAGTQNFFGVISMATALNKLSQIGWNNIIAHECQIRDYLIQQMKQIPKLTMYGDTTTYDDRLGIIVFNLQDYDHEKLSNILAEDRGIATRCGKFCAHPYVTRLLGIPNDNCHSEIQDICGCVRISVGLYNTLEEAKILIQYLQKLCH